MLCKFMLGDICLDDVPEPWTLYLLSRLAGLTGVLDTLSSRGGGTDTRRNVLPS